MIKQKKVHFFSGTMCRFKQREEYQVLLNGGGGSFVMSPSSLVSFQRAMASVLLRLLP